MGIAEGGKRKHQEGEEGDEEGGYENMGRGEGEAGDLT